MAIVQENTVDLKTLCTMRLGGTARDVVTVDTEEDLSELFTGNLVTGKWFLLGGGSNVVFPDTDITDTLIIRLGISHIVENNGTLRVGAARSWDEVVAYAVENGLSGIEALSFIPGTAGATPVQNVGAYGTEIANVLVSLRAFDTKEKKFIELTNAECAFAYRDSIFKREGKGRYIITEITLKLSSDEPNVPQYPGVAEYLAQHNIRAASLSDIRNAIIAIRTKKLPDPREVASVGSFFKNTFVPIELAQKLKAEYPTLAVFPVDADTAKVGTGSLIDTMGWKGKKIGNFSLYKGNAMVIVNEGGGTRAELEKVVKTIQNAVLEKYGIAIEPEPELLDL